MATLKIKELKNMAKSDREKKIKELKLELVKSKVNASKNKTSKTKEIKKILARLLTLNKSEENKKSKEELKKQ